MNIHEYQAKEILKNFNVKIQEGYVASSPDEAYQNAKKLYDEKDTNIFVIKSSIRSTIFSLRRVGFPQNSNINFLSVRRFFVKKSQNFTILSQDYFYKCFLVKKRQNYTFSKNARREAPPSAACGVWEVFPIRSKSEN